MESLIYIILSLLPTYLIRGEIFGVPVTFLEILILILFLVFALKNKFKFSLGNYKYAVGLFMALGIAATIISPDLRSALGLLKAYIIEPVLFFIVVINVKPNFKKTIIALSLGGVVVAIVGVLQYFTGYGIPSPWNIPGAEYRITSIYDYPNAVGLYLAPLIILSLGCFIKCQKKSLGWLNLILLGGAAVIFSKAQGAYVAIMAGIFALGLSSKKWRAVWMVTLVLGFALVLIIPSTREVLLFKDNSGQVRLAMWQGTTNLLIHNPITGSGLAGFQTRYPEYKLNQHTEALLYAHNIFLDFWCQLGILGLVWLIWILVKYFKAGKKNNPRNIILNAALLGILVYGLVDVPYFKNDLALIFWTLLGLKEITK